MLLGGKDGVDPTADELAVFCGFGETWRLIDDAVGALPTEEGTKAVHLFRLDARRTVTVLANKKAREFAYSSLLLEKYDVDCGFGAAMFRSAAAIIDIYSGGFRRIICFYLK